MHPNEQALAFIKANPNTAEAAITTATKIRGLQLFNILKKKLLTDGEITSIGEGSDTLYSSSVIKEEVVADEQQEDKPNLFKIATEELSHDAAMTWLFQWAYPNTTSICLLKSVRPSLLTNLKYRKHENIHSYCC